MTKRRAFTLVEMIVSLAIATVLLVSMGSVMVLASRAIPQPQSRATRALDAARALEIIADDLAYAESITAGGRVTATVSDRNGDKQPEQVIYGLQSGTSTLVAAWEDPTLRTLVLLEDVSSFAVDLETDGAASVAVSIELTLTDMPAEPFRRRVQLVNRPE